MDLHIHSFIPIGKIKRLSYLKILPIHREFGFDPPQELFDDIIDMKLKDLVLVKTDARKVPPHVLANAINSLDRFKLDLEVMDSMTTFQLEKILVMIVKGSTLKYVNLGTLLYALEVSTSLLSQSVLKLKGFTSIGSAFPSTEINGILEEPSQSPSSLSFLDLSDNILEDLDTEELVVAVCRESRDCHNEKLSYQNMLT